VYSTLGADHRLFALLSRTTRLGSPVYALLLQALITVGFLLVLGTRRGHEETNLVLQWFHDAIQQVLLSLRLVEQASAWEVPKWGTGDAFEALVSHTAPVFWVFFLMTGLSLFVLREKNPNKERPYSVPLYPILPIIFCNVCVYMIYQSSIYVGWRALFALGLLALGLPLFWISRKLGGKPATASSGSPKENFFS
jgi:basic amino acid/polyamine antiporter, APA family